MVLTISGKKQYLRRAVDRDGFVLDVLVQSRPASDYHTARAQAFATWAEIAGAPLAV